MSIMSSPQRGFAPATIAYKAIILTAKTMGAGSRCWARTSDIRINSPAQLPTVLNGNNGRRDFYVRTESPLPSSRRRILGPERGFALPT